MNHCVHIASHETLAAVCAAARPTHLIVVRDRGDAGPALPEAPSIITLSFNDFEGPEPTGPTYFHAESVA